jgi:hypothetical protein
MSVFASPVVSRILRGVRALSVATLVLGSALALSLTGAPRAEASAYGVAYWGVHTVKDVPIPAGQLFGAIEGKKLSWRDAGGSFLSAGTICNWHFSVVFYEGARKDGKTTVIDQDNQPSCARTGAFKVANTAAMAAPEGSVCIRLYRDFGNEQLASVCHSVHR